jgi:hypothetical protein
MLKFKSITHSLYKVTVEALLEITFSNNIDALPAVP